MNSLYAFDSDIDALLDYIAKSNVVSYVLLAIDKKEQDYYIAYGYKNCPDHLVTILDYVIEDLENTRKKDD